MWAHGVPSTCMLYACQKILLHSLYHIKGNAKQSTQLPIFSGNPDVHVVPPYCGVAKSKNLIVNFLYQKSIKVMWYLHDLMAVKVHTNEIDR